MTDAATGRPAPDASVIERIDWLLRSVPLAPGGTTTRTLDQVVAALARSAVPDDRDIQPMAAARGWLAALRADEIDPAGPGSRPYLRALEELFRLPQGYFLDSAVSQETDDRILFAAAAAASGVRIIGPCRASQDEFTVEELHRLHLHMRDALARARGSESPRP